MQGVPSVRQFAKTTALGCSFVAGCEPLLVPEGKHALTSAQGNCRKDDLTASVRGVFDYLKMRGELYLGRKVSGCEPVHTREQ